MPTTFTTARWRLGRRYHPYRARFKSIGKGAPGPGISLNGSDELEDEDEDPDEDEEDEELEESPELEELLPDDEDTEVPDPALLEPPDPVYPEEEYEDMVVGSL